MAGDDRLPTPRQILIAHDEIEEAYDLKYRGVRAAAPRLELREILQEVREYDRVYMRAACLLRKTITAHLFEDANKRTAWSITRQYLEKHDLEPAERREVVVAHVLRSIRGYDVDEIAEWLETGAIDRTRLNP